MIVHTGPARRTVTLDDGSVWSWKGDYWLSGADFPDHLWDETTDSPRHSRSGLSFARRVDPIRYNDGQPLTDNERAGLAAIMKATSGEETGP